MVGHATATQQIIPSALLTIDQNRPTVIERIVGEWGDRLSSSSAGIGPAQLREILGGLRADALLAASLAGSLDGLRDVVATAMTSTAPLTPGRVMPMSLGDVNADLVYTPITPCRILDTRNGTIAPYNSVMVGGAAFPVTASLVSFAPQGGSATNCGLPTSFQAIAVTFTVLNPNFDAFLAASNTSNFATLTQSVVMDFSANRGLANTAIVPVDATVKFFLGLPAQVTTHVLADAVGYFRRPGNYGGTHVITGLNATDSGGSSNTASGNFSTVSGGVGNTAGNQYATVAGGSGNTASGEASTVPGGVSNTASGAGSFAAGLSARANNNGCFVWGDASTFNEVNCSGGANQVVMRALGGFYFLTAGAGPYTGAQLPSGAGAWTTFSDRAGKDSIRQVDSREVLRKLVSLPIATWNWKAQDASIRHMGPMAQDFSAAFGLGETDKGISTVDADGVALAAIQGLHQLMREKDRQIAQLKRKLRAIEAKLGL